MPYYPADTQKYTYLWSKYRPAILKFMVDDHDFSQVRIEKRIDKLLEIKREGIQSKLETWFKK